MAQPWERDWSGSRAPWERDWAAEKPAAPKERTTFEAVKDVGAGLVSGVGALAQVPGQLYGLATGDFSDTGLTKVGRQLRETGEAMKSEELKRREAERAAKIKEAGKEGEVSAGLAAFKETIADPALLTNFIAEQAPNLIPGLAVARGLRLAGAGAKAATAGAVGTGATQQGADIGAETFKEMHKKLVDQGMSPEEATGRVLGFARAAGLEAGVISLGAQMLPGGRAIERAMAKTPIKGGRIISGVKGGAGEAVSEMIEEGGGKVAQNLAVQNVDPTRSLTEGLGETMGMAAVGGLGLGTAAGVVSRREAPEVKPEPTAEPAAGAEPPAEPPLLLEGKGAFVPVALPDGTVAMTREDLAQYEEDQFRKKYEPQMVEQEAAPEAEAAAEVAPQFNYGSATQEILQLKQQPKTPETLARIQELEAVKAEMLMDQMRRANEPLRPELMQLREQMESGALTEEGFNTAFDNILADFERQTRGLQRMKQPKSEDQIQIDQEIAALNAEYSELTKEARAKSAEIRGLQSARGEKYNLGTFLKNKLSREEVLDINPDKSFAKKFLAPRSEPGASVAELVAFGQLDQWLPPNMRKGAENFDEKESTEYIKEKLRDADYRPHIAEETERSTGEELARIEERIRQLEAARKSMQQLPEMTPEELQQEAASMAAEAGFEGAPAEVTAVPQEQEEYFPDQGEIRGQLAQRQVVNKAPDWVPQNIWDLHEKVQRADAEASGEVPLRPNKEGKVPRTQDLKRNQVMAFRRLNAAVEEYVGNDWQKVNDLMVRMNQESSRRAEEAPRAEREASAINKDRESERIEKELTGKTMLGAAQWAVDNAPNQFAKAIAQKVMNRLNGMARRGIKLEFEVAGGKNRPAKMFNARGLVEYDFGRAGEGKQPSFKLTINGAPVMDNQFGYPPGTRYITVLHELLHVATSGQINVLKGDDPLVKELRGLFNQVVDHFNKEVRAGRITPFMNRMYKQEINALTDPDELLAWGIADRDMQEFLSEIKVGDKTIMDKLVELIRKILNVTKPYLTALDQLVKTTESILDEDVDVVADKIVAKRYSFGNKPGVGEAIQGTLFQKEGKPFADAPVDPSKGPKRMQDKLEEKWDKMRLGAPKEKPSSFEGVDDNLWEQLSKTFFPQNKNIVQKIDGMRDRFWQRLAQGIADQYRTIKNYDEEAYMKARMAKTIDGALEGILFNGEVKLTDGALDIAKDTKGLLKALEPVGAEVDRYQIWVALNRENAIYEKSLKAESQIDSLKLEIKRLAAERKAAGTAREANRINDQIEQIKREITNLRSSIKGTSINPDVVAKRDQLSAGKINGKSRLEVYQQVQKDMNKLNRSVLNIALKQGLINKEAYDIYANDINYIPFYKVMDEGGDVQAAATKSGLVNQYFSKALKGGEKPFGDLMENTLRNWSHILSASMKNEAANATIKAAMDMGAAFPNLKAGLSWEDGKVVNKNTGKLIGDGSLKPEYTSSDGKGLVKTMIDGKPAYFDASKDQLLLESIMSIGYMGPKSKFLDVARNFKNMLQFGVTLSPAFKVRNLFRDSIAAMATSGLKQDPFGNVVQGWADSDRNNPAHISALAGGAIFNFGSMYEGDQAKLVKRLIEQGVNPDTILTTEDKIKNALPYMWRKYQEWGNKSESVNRMALYRQLREKGLGHLEASFQARDLLDFSMQGAWPTFRYLTQIIPFLNARVQGLYKLGRDGIIPTSRAAYSKVTGKDIWDTSTDEGKKRKLSDKQKAEQFSTIMVAVGLASLALYMAFKDDEEFQKREQWDRDNFWWFKLPGMDSALRLPKPFELGAFGTMVERVAEQAFDKGVEGKVFRDSLSRMLTDTFAVNLPQIFKPLVDLYANKDSFTGAPIETAGMERLSKEQRIAEKTSPLAIALSKTTNVFLPESTEISPVQADYAIKGYLGWMGGTASWLSHYAVMPFSKSAYPDNNWTETLSMGFIKSLPATQSKYVTAFYENNKQISQAYADMRHFAQLGEADKVQEILKEKGDKIAMAKFYDNAAKDMSEMRKTITAIRNDQSMSGDQKKEEIDRMKVLIGEIARQMEEARIEVKKQFAAAQ